MMLAAGKYVNANGDVIQDRTQKWSWSLSSCGRGPRGTVVRSEMRSRNFSKETDPDRSRSLGPRSAAVAFSRYTQQLRELDRRSGVRCALWRCEIHLLYLFSCPHCLAYSPLLRVHIWCGASQGRTDSLKL